MPRPKLPLILPIWSKSNRTTAAKRTVGTKTESPVTRPAWCINLDMLFLQLIEGAAHPPCLAAQGRLHSRVCVGILHIPRHIPGRTIETKVFLPIVAELAAARPSSTDDSGKILRQDFLLPGLAGAALSLRSVVWAATAADGVLHYQQPRLTPSEWGDTEDNRPTLLIRNVANNNWFAAGILKGN